MWQARDKAKQFFTNRPKTSLFLGTTLFLGSLPITIFTSIILCVSLVLAATFLFLQGTVLAVTFVGLATSLAGPTFIAAIVTIIFYVVRQSYRALRCQCLRMSTKSRTVIESHAQSDNENTPGNTDPQNHPIKNTENETPKGIHYQCEFCRANRHDLCVSRQRAHAGMKTAGQETNVPST